MGHRVLRFVTVFIVTVFIVAVFIVTVFIVCVVLRGDTNIGDGFLMALWC
jgi:hypothetical protein